MESEQSSGILVLLFGAAVIASQITVEPMQPEPVVTCQFSGKPTGRDADGVQTFDYFRRCDNEWH